MKRLFVILIFLPILFLSCTVGPKYKPVKVKVPDKWYPEDVIKESGISVSKKIGLDEIKNWWKQLNDSCLDRLIEQAIKGNLDIKVALARLKEERALRGREKARLFPYINAEGSAVRKRISESGKTSELYSLNIDASWEADIFGSIRSSIQEAEARLLAAKEGLKDVIVSLVAEVAINYIELRTYQARLKAVIANAKAQEGIYKLNLSRYKAGLIDELYVQQSKYVLESTKAQIPSLQEGIEKAKNRIAVLLGKNPGELDKELSRFNPIPTPPVKLVIGIPANTIRSRPDVRKAEMNLIAATAAIRRAKAELYPQLQLSGSIGLESISKGDLFKWASRTWSLATNITWKIFHAGELRQNVKVYTERQKQALYEYQNTVLNAIEEVRNAIIAYVKEQKRLYALERAVEAAKKSYELALDRYRAGISDFIDVLDAERSLQSLQDQLSVSKGQVAINLVRIYKALGGGWSAFLLQVGG